MEYAIVDGRLVTIENPNNLEHHGIKGMQWGVRRFQKKDGSLTSAGRARRARVSRENKDAKSLNKVNDKNGAVLSRKKSWRDDPVERKKRIDADMKEADERVKFYGSKRAAKIAIKDEAEYAKSVNRGKAFVNTIKFGGIGGASAGLLTGIALDAEILLAAGPAAGLVAAGLITGTAAAKANALINKHANDQIVYTDDSEYGHDIVVAMKRR